MEPALGTSPAHNTTQLAPAAGTRDVVGAAAHAAQPPKRVLIVDDNRDSADPLALLLTLCGHEVRSLCDGAAAIDSARAFSPDLIVMDLGLPGLDGYAAARRLRQDGCAARLTAITGYGRPEDRRRAEDAGFDDFLIKPIDPRDLERLLREPPPVHATQPMHPARPAHTEQLASFPKI